MALVDHIIRCNRADLANFRPLLVAGQDVGRVSVAIAARLRDFPTLFHEQRDAILLSDHLTDPAARSDALRPVAERLVAAGLIEKLRGEDYRVVAEWGAEPLLLVDRAVAPALGVKSFGIHVNGYVERPDGLHLWIGRRAGGKMVEPGKLDNLVAGGQPAGLSLRQNLVKESAEEAGIAAELALQARPVGTITYCMQMGASLKRDTLFLYDLRLEEDFVPVAVDGEMENFRLMAIPEILALLRDGFPFKFNVALVLIDFLIRHGQLDPDQEPDYAALAAGLHRAF